MTSPKIDSPESKNGSPQEGAKKNNPNIKLRLIVGVIGAAALALIASPKPNEPQPSAPAAAASTSSSSVESAENEEQKLGRIIKRIEEVLKELGPQMHDAVFQADVDHTDLVKRALEFAKHNENYKWKNAVTFDGSHQQYSLFDGTDSFHYDLYPERQLTAGDNIAGFRPVNRRLMLDQNIDPDNPLDIAVVIHELMHAVQHFDYRAQMKTPPQRSTYSQVVGGEVVTGKVFYPLDETPVTINEVVILNKLMNGKLKQYAKTKVIPPDAFKGLTDTQKELLKDMVMLAHEHYYGGGIKNFFLREMPKRGYKMLMIIPGGYGDVTVE